LIWQERKTKSFMYWALGNFEESYTISYGLAIPPSFLI
jgi:hypothetical protein